MVTIGFADGLAIKALLNPVVGDHEYVYPPEAVMATDCPRQIRGSCGVRVTVGLGCTLMVSAKGAIELQPFKSFSISNGKYSPGWLY